MTKNQVHEWHESRHDDDGKHYKQYFRGHYNGRDWRFETTGPADPDWLILDHAPLEVWEALREVIFKKYQRKRINYKLMESLDKILADMRGTLPAAES
jgi:hypothetical protein